MPWAQMYVLAVAEVDIATLLMTLSLHRQSLFSALRAKFKNGEK